MLSIGIGRGARTKAMHQISAAHKVSAPLRVMQAVCYTRLNKGVVVDTKFIDEISRRAQELIANTPVEDVQKNMRALMSSWLSRLDLVTREEFDVQADLLRRTREKLTQMETRIAELEQSQKKAGE